MGKVAKAGAWELEGGTEASVLGEVGALGLSGERTGEQGGGQGGVCARDKAFRLLGTPPPGERASAAEGKLPSHTALMCHGSRHHTVPRQGQQ